MSIIKPFRGYLPPSEIAGKVSSPPYDVLSSDEAREMAQNNPDSFLRIIKPQIDYMHDSEPSGDSLHQHAAENLRDFIRSGKLEPDHDLCFYLYQIIMGNHTQTGIMASVSVNDYNQGCIKKHEFTRPDKEDDRSRHIEITNANTGPVFLTFRNDGKFQIQIREIKRRNADLSFQANDQTIHKLWKISNPDDQKSLSTYFQSLPTLYIAVGHHFFVSKEDLPHVDDNQNQ